MNFTITKQDNKILAKVEGRIGTAETAEFERLMQPLYEGENLNIEMDCSELSYISSSGLRLLITLQKSINERHCNLVLTNMQESVKRVFVMTGFCKIINVR